MTESGLQSTTVVGGLYRQVSVIGARGRYESGAKQMGKRRRKLPPPLSEAQIEIMAEARRIREMIDQAATEEDHS